jgi:hypothetical protein
MISLRDDFEPDYDEARLPVPADVIEFWKDVFSALLPPEEGPSEQEG